MSDVMTAKEGTFADKLRSNAKYLRDCYEGLTSAEAEVIADKLEQAAFRLEQGARTEARDKAFVAWMQKEVPITFASLWGQFDEAPRSPQLEKPSLCKMLKTGDANDCTCDPIGHPQEKP